MPVCFTPGQQLGRNDLDIFLTNANGNPQNAAEITYAIFFVDLSAGPPGIEILIGSPTRTPLNPAVGEYYAPLLVPTSATPGCYHIRWTFKQFAGSPDEQVVQEWGVVQEGTITGVECSPATMDMIRRLRILLRDQNPDKFYRFRPPEHEGTIGDYNRVFGYIWEDEELYEYLVTALDWWNMAPPETESLFTLDTLVAYKPSWRTPVIWGAIIHAAMALAFNWVADEFDYSCGGISLSIEKSSKYESLKSNAEGKWTQATEWKARTTKYIRGLQQPRFGRGVRSAFGPYVGRGVLSPRNFI